ncbi:MAG: HD domain-containing protein [Opitutaceae bacterium]|jgi:(p)ppGpp synthase/HD superfamily hydrolase|nr:HD domain-containing protein [Opitutaceae bacterium]
MSQPPEIELAAAIARRAHHGQTRNDRATPYAAHPESVARRLRGEDATVIATAWLHDVLEDTAETAASLRAAGVGDAVISAVQAMTKQPGEPYEIYLGRVKAHPVARKVKMADMLDNLGDSPNEKQIRKYAKGLLFLLDN